MLECVVNISEGRDAERLDEFVRLVGTALLDLHADASHNRSVFTLAGPETADAARELARAAVASLDIARHSGVHPRLGVVDVVPFVPLGPDALRPDVDLDEAIAARDLFAALGRGRARRPLLSLRTGTRAPRDPPPRLRRPRPRFRTEHAAPLRRGELRRGASRARRLQPLARRSRPRPGAPHRPHAARSGGAHRRLRRRCGCPGLLQPRRTLERRPRRRLRPGRRIRAASSGRNSSGSSPRRSCARFRCAVGRRSTSARTRRSRRGSPTGASRLRLRRRQPRAAATGAPDERDDVRARSSRPRCRTSHCSQSRTRGNRRAQRNRDRPPSPPGSTNPVRGRTTPGRPPCSSPAPATPVDLG